MKIVMTSFLVFWTCAAVHGQSVWFGSDHSLNALNDHQTMLISELPENVELLCRTSDGGAWVHVANEASLRRYSSSGQLLNEVATEIGLAGMALDASGVLWATRPGLDDVIRVNEDSGILESIPVAGVPYGVTVDGLGSIWVSCSFSNEVVKLSSDGQLVQTTPVGFFPTGISATHDGGVWLAEKQGLRRLDSNGQTVWADVAGVFPIGVTTDLQGRGWFTCQSSHQVVVVSDAGIDLILDVSERPLGIAAHADGSVTVLSRLGSDVQRFSASGNLIISQNIPAPGGMGDLTGLQTALVVSPWSDFDGDGIANGDEVLLGSDPYYEPQQLFVRGDVDRNGVVQLTDAILALGILYSGSETNCLEAVDVNADDQLNLADPIRILGYLFSGAQPPESPFPVEGEDPAPIPGFSCPE